MNKLRLLLIMPLTALTLSACLGTDGATNGCDEAMLRLKQAQASYQAAMSAGMGSDTMDTVRQALDMAWLAVPHFCPGRPDASPAGPAPFPG